MRAKNPERTMDFYKASVERYNYIKAIYPDLIENDICIEGIIINSYLHNNKDVQNFLNNENAISFYNSLFKFDIMRYDISFNEKIKMVLFRISPNVFLWIMNKYLSSKNI